MKYYIGLDMGVSSIGWSATNENYEILRKRGKDLWGIREFEEAETAKERRINRGIRRMLRRKKYRLKMLRSYFNDEIKKIDKDFFLRLDESKYHLEDKKIGAKYILFNDEDYTDKDYFREYPTIFHLRKELIDNDKWHDIRLIFLAIENIFKHRGHFLNKELDLGNIGNSLEDSYTKLICLMNDLFEKTVLTTDIDFKEFEKILSENKNPKKLEKELQKIMKIGESDLKELEIIKAICGSKFSLKKLFQDESFEDISFRFSDENWEENCNILNGDKLNLINELKKIYDIKYLLTTLKNSKYLSEQRVKDYEKHKQDLSRLKKIIKENNQKKSYYELFKNSDKDIAHGSYSAYVGSSFFKTKLRRNVKENKQADLYKKIKEILKNLPNTDEKSNILNEIENETFLPKQLSSMNGSIPNQLHLYELKKILTNAEKHYSFLKEKDKNNLSISAKIIKLFEFQIPYYVGPLHKNNPCLVRKDENGKIFPWNFEDKVNLEKTKEKFINNLVSSCTNLIDKKVLPKHSLLYEKYMVLNELNNLKIKGKKIHVNLKKKIYNDLFLQNKKVTKSMLKKYLISEGVIAKSEEGDISGIDGDFKAALTSYHKFKNIFPEKINTDAIQEICESVIFYSTVYGDDKELLQKKLETEFSAKLSKNDIDAIKKLQFTDWGEFSKEFLELKGCNKFDGELVSIIDMLWQSNDNLSQLLSKQYTYSEEIDKINKNAQITKQISNIELGKIDRDSRGELEDYLVKMYFSAPVKKMILQTIDVVNEIINVIGENPQKIFIEMARSNEVNPKITISRKNQLIKLYKKVNEPKLKNQLDNESDKTLRDRKRYLYYLQKGKCMYSGEEINYSDIENNNLYDKDHIYPQSCVKDDSIINNLVLVKKEINQSTKGSEYPLPKSIREKMKNFWQELLKEKFISQEKYNRLVCEEGFTDSKLAEFIDRQLVETRQASKAILNLFQNICPKTKTKIKTIKAELISDFRQKFKLYKSRELNDFHHAQDAYLSIVVGNVYDEKFTSDSKIFIEKYKNAKHEKYHMKNIFDYDVKRNGNIAWIAKGDEKTFNTVEKMIDKNSPLITRKAFEQTGKLFDATIYGKNTAKAGKHISVKSSDERLQNVSKYGGYNSVKAAYFFLVKHGNKKRTRTLETMPIYLKNKYGKNIESLEKYCIEKLGLINPKILYQKIKYQSLVKIDGFFYHLSGKTCNQISLRNATPMILERKWVNYIKKIENFSSKGYVEKEITKEKNEELYAILKNKFIDTIFRNCCTKKTILKNFQDGEDKFKNLTVEKQCKVILEKLKSSKLGITIEDMRISKNINNKRSNHNEFLLIHQSPTGLYEKKVDLLDKHLGEKNGLENNSNI